MASEKADIGKIAHTILRRLKVCQCLIWAGIMLVLFVVCSAVFAGLCLTGLSPATLNLLAWVGCLGSATGCIYGAYRSCNDERLFPLMKANLLKLYPEQRKYFDAWLATELYAPDGEATWKLLNRRLQEQVPAGNPKGLKMFPGKYVWILIPGMILVVSSVFPGRTQTWTQVYARRLMLGHDSRPLQIVSIKPERRWVLSGEPFEMNLVFDREVEGDVTATLETTGEVLTFDRKTSRSFHATIPAQYRKFYLNVAAERLRTERIRYKILPAEPIELKSIAVLDDDDAISRLILPRDLPTDVPDGSRLRFVVSLAPGPWESFGLGSRRHGEVFLTHIGMGGNYHGTATLYRDDDFFMFWQLPGRSIEQSPSFSIQCLPNQLPKPVIHSPEEGNLLPVEATSVDVDFGGTDDDEIDAAWLWVTDYYDMLHKIEIPIADGVAANVKQRFSLELDQLPPHQGRVLGLCLVMRDTSRKRQLGRSDVVNLLLSEGELSPENREKMRQFWEDALARNSSSRPQENNALEELLAQPQDGQGQPQDGQGQAQGGEGQAQGGEGQAQGGEGQAQGGEGQAQGGQGQAQGGQGQAQGGEGQAQGGQGQAQSGEGQAQSGEGSGSGTSPGGTTPDGAPAKLEDPNKLASGSKNPDGDGNKKPDDEYSNPNATVVTSGSKMISKPGDETLADVPSNQSQTGNLKTNTDEKPDSINGEAGKALGESLANGTLGGKSASSGRSTTSTDEQKRIMKKLTPEERRKLREYYRYLQDLK